MTEKNIIKSVLSRIPDSPAHKNKFFESDSEVLEIDGRDYLVSMDSFSREDGFRDADPYLLGRNLAVCTISDVLACGGKPIFFANSLTMEPAWNEEYVSALATGIGEVITACGAIFAGGDLGSADSWNYTGVAFGRSEKPILRRGASEGDIIYVSGEIGLGNFEAAYTLLTQGPGLFAESIGSGKLKQEDLAPMQSAINALFSANPVKFPLRLKESQLIKDYAASCIDTSDGLINGIMTISEINEVGFMLDEIPYFEPGQELVKLCGLPGELLAFGECGEYELLFTVNPNMEQSFLEAAEKSDLTFYRLGAITDSSTKTVRSGEKSFDLADYKLSARDFPTRSDFVSTMIKFIKSSEQR